MGLNTNEPTTTEIYADEAFFDSTKNMGTFSGRVKVTDPRFNLQSDKLTVFITKGENQGLEKAIAEGNVGLVRERPDPSGGPPTRAVGRADKATYTAATGDVELRGTPRVQEGANMHVATSPDTVMIINQNSQLTTHGPSRTEIRQVNEGRTGRKEKKKRSKEGRKLKPRRLSPCPQQPCRHHDQPNCARFHSETIFGGRAEGGDCSYDRPTGEDLRRPGSGGRGEHERARG